MPIHNHGKKSTDPLDFVESESDFESELDIADIVFAGGSFGGNIKVASLQRAGQNLNGIQSYNLVGGKNENVSDTFKGLAIPSVLLNIPKFYENDIESEEADRDPQDYGGHYGGGKKQLMHNNPTAGVISEDLYDKFLKMAQDLDMYKSNRRTKKQKVVTSSKKIKKTRRRK